MNIVSRYMNILSLEDLKGYTYGQLVEHIVEHYEAKREDVEKYNFLIAYESVGDWGCDSSSFFLLRDKESGKLFENHSSHCSCYGFEGQWVPEETTLEYLKSNGFYFSCGGYDNTVEFNRKAVRKYIEKLYY